MKRYTVLTYIIGGYEQVHEVLNKDPMAEYLLITDNKELKSQTWTILYDPDLQGLSTFDKCYAIRFNCFKYCHTDICVRIDGSIQVLNSLKALIDIFEEGEYDMALMPHPFHHNLIDEYNIWVKWRGYDPKQAERCISYMRHDGYDFNYKGLFQCCFSIQRRGELSDRIDKRTLACLKELGSDGKIERIDQIPFSYIMNTYFNEVKVLPVSEQILRSYYLQWFKHNSNEPNNDIFYDIRKEDIKYMFNKQVACLYLTSPIQNRTVLKKDVSQETLMSLEGKKVAVHVHLFYLDLLDYVVKYLNNIPVIFDLFVSVPDSVECDVDNVRKHLLTIKNVGTIDIRITPNVGRDIAPMLCTFGELLQHYDFISHFHTKKTLEDVSLIKWRDHIYSHLLGSEKIVTNILSDLDNHVGMVAPPDYSSCWDVSGWSSNLQIAQTVLDQSPLKINLREEYPVIAFPQGTMFWARADYLKAFFELPLSYKSFPDEPIERDGTIAHALERLFFVWGRDTGMPVQNIFLSEDELSIWSHMKTMMVNRECELQDLICKMSGESNGGGNVVSYRDKTKKHLRAIRILSYLLGISVIVIIVLCTILMS